MSEVLWYYEEGGKQAGPISQAAMAEAIRSGRLPAGSRVWRAGMAGWQPWEAVPELAGLAPPPPVGSPPPLAGPPPAPAGWGATPTGTWGPPQGAGTAPFPPNSYAAEVLAPGAPGALYPKAPFGGRFVAYLLDSLIAVVPLMLAGVGVAVGVGSESTPLLVVSGIVAFAGLVWSLWYGFTKDGRPNGQSVGKKAMGLMVVHLPTNQPCDRGKSALRYLVLFGLNLIPYVGWLVEPIVTLSAAGGQRLGDKAAGTQVIAVGDYKPRR
jgi:uncharacterized RDD family membrane protein YckC